MTTTTATYTQARTNLAELLSKVYDNNEIVIINRRKSEKVALISAEELASLLETAHLLRSPKNAERLLTAYNRAKSKTRKTQTVEQLKKDLRFGKEN